jgi:hypothetical protein
MGIPDPGSACHPELHTHLHLHLRFSSHLPNKGALVIDEPRYRLPFMFRWNLIRLSKLDQQNLKLQCHPIIPAKGEERLKQLSIAQALLFFTTISPFYDFRGRLIP